MKKPPYIEISIPQPCSQAWADMTPNEKGRHCAHCDRTVIDFTCFTDSELYSFFANNNEKVCGRYFSTQLDRRIPMPCQQGCALFRMAAALGFTLMFTQSPNVHAQEKATTTLSQAKGEKRASVIVPERGIKGAVYDDGYRLPGATVKLYRGDKLVGTYETDLYGFYTIKQLDSGRYKIVVSYPGLEGVADEVLVSDDMITFDAHMKHRKIKEEPQRIVTGGI
jgi:hypothetical protein